MLFQIFIIAIATGLLNAFRGSGWLQQHGYDLAADILKWAFIPLVLFGGVMFVHGSASLGIAATLPYYFLMRTGTGGCMQANINNPVESTKGWPPFATICDKVARAVLGSSIQDPPQYQYYKIWGFMYDILVAAVFTLPFLLTQYAYSLPLFLFPVTCRYLVWRANEFLLLFGFSLLFMLSIAY